jgi:hypothetical protein
VSRQRFRRGRDRTVDVGAGGDGACPDQVAGREIADFGGDDGDLALAARREFSKFSQNSYIVLL